MSAQGWAPNLRAFPADHDPGFEPTYVQAFASKQLPVLLICKTAIDLQRIQSFSDSRISIKNANYPCFIAAPSG
jgi:hypothetical protein